jgi:hypothetical protein
MSDMMQATLVARLEGDSVLNGMLARDPHAQAGGRPALFSAWKANAPEALPQLLLMEAGDRADPKETLSGYVFHETWHFQAWVSSTTTQHKTIMERVKRLLHEQHFPLADTRYNLKYLYQTGGLPDGYDPSLRESFAIQVYEVCYSYPGDWQAPA